MVEERGRYGGGGVEWVKRDGGFMKEGKGGGDVVMGLDGEEDVEEEVWEKVLGDNVLIGGGCVKGDGRLWWGLMEDGYKVMRCIEKEGWVVVEEDVNSDGEGEGMVFGFNDERVIVYGFE